MTALKITLIIFTILLLSVGQVLFKIASNDLVLSPARILPSLINLRLIIALVVYFIATVLWLFALKDVPLRMAYPFAALAFFIVPVLAYFLLDESLGWNTFAGALIIGFGVLVSTYK